MNRVVLMLAIFSISTNTFAGGKRQAERAWNVEVELVRYELGTWSWLADDLALARSLWKEGHLEQSDAVLRSLNDALTRDRGRISSTLGESPLLSLEHALSTFHQERSSAAGISISGGTLPLPRLGLRADASDEDDEDTKTDDADRSRANRREAERGQRTSPDPVDRQERPMPGGDRY